MDNSVRYICVYYLRTHVYIVFFPHVFLLISISLFFVTVSIPGIRREKNIARSKRNIWRGTFRAVTRRAYGEPFAPPPFSPDSFLSSASRRTSMVQKERRERATHILSRSRSPECIYTLGVTNYADNDRAQCRKEGALEIRESPGRDLSAFRAVFNLFIFRYSATDIPVWVPPLPFPEYTLMSVITLGYGVRLLYFSRYVYERKE